jgi:glycosyltransferase involved in cell wall biosynthesis
MSMSVSVAAKSLASASPQSRSLSTPRAMSVAIYMHDLTGGGVERQSLIIAEELRRHGANVTLVLHRLRGDLVDQLPAGLRVVDLRSSRTLMDVFRLVGFLRREKPDILVANVDLNNIAALLAKAISFSATKVVICQHNTMNASFISDGTWLYRYLAWSYRRLSPLIGGAVGVSQGVAAELAEAAGLPNGSVLTINNPVVGPDFAARCEEPAEHPWFKQRQGPVFVTAGRLVPQKDHETMLQALAIHRRSSNSRLIVLGSGPLCEQLKQQVVEAQMTDAVDFQGFRSNVLPYIRQADAFLLSSRCEGFGNVIVEALGCGTPVIATNCEYGPAEILDHGRFGLLVKPRDPEAMAEAMDQVATLRAQFPAAMLKQRAAEFSYSACASRYMTLFKALAPHRAWTSLA